MFRTTNTAFAIGVHVGVVAATIALQLFSVFEILRVYVILSALTCLASAYYGHTLLRAWTPAIDKWDNRSDHLGAVTGYLVATFVGILLVYLANYTTAIPSMLALAVMVSLTTSGFIRLYLLMREYHL